MNIHTKVNKANDTLRVTPRWFVKQTEVVMKTFQRSIVHRPNTKKLAQEALFLTWGW